MKHEQFLHELETALTAYGRLHDIVSDCVESGRLSEADLPDDYQAIVQALTASIRSPLPEDTLKALRQAIEAEANPAPDKLACESDLTWSAEDSAAAMKQGWDVFEIDGNGEKLAIQRCDDSGVFKEDLAAVAFVKRQAAQGDALAAKAVRLDCYESAILSDAPPVKRHQPVVVDRVRLDGTDFNVPVRNLALKKSSGFKPGF